MFTYIIFTIITAGFGFGYEQFSHEVYSMFMIYAFLVPLVLGALPLIIISLFFSNHLPSRLSLNLYNSGIAALTVGSIYQGVLEIYGTTNNLIFVYLIVGTLFLIAGASVYIAKIANPK
ncbi:MAG: hypothetical protein IJV39_05570 [Ruminococcus sp.]|nr:hypothetical protein [Ruminococcus sp.]